MHLQALGQFSQLHRAAQPLILDPASERFRRDNMVIGVAAGEALAQPVREERE